jgi:hypothetical protein
MKFPTLKKCADCGEHKPEHDFYRNSAARDNRDTICIACRKARNNKNYEANRKNFKQTVVTAGDGTKANRKVIICCKCGAEETAPSKMHDDGARKIFHNKGWFIGKRRVDDLCPDCRVDKPKDPAEPELFEMPMHPAMQCEAISEPEPVMEEPMLDKVLHADEPRKPTIAQKRLILEKLDDVYPVPDKGYIKGYTDERLAKELNMPRAWITERRLDMYGSRETPPVDMSVHAKTLDALRGEMQILVKRGLEAERAIQVQEGIIVRQNADIQAMKQKIEALEADLKAAIDLALVG